VNWTALGAIAETLGALAVVLSLLYIAAQVRHAIAQARVDAGSTFTARWAEVYHFGTGDRQTAEVFLRGSAEPEALDPVDQIRFRGVMHAFWRLMEDEYYVHAAGKLDAERWAATRRTMADYMSLPGVQRFLLDRGHWYTPAFVEFVWGLADVGPHSAFAPSLRGHVAEAEAAGSDPREATVDSET